MAALVPIGNVVGLDYEPSVLEEARALVANRGLENVTFEVGDITTGLKYPDDHFDIVHSHQVLQHLADPVAAIQEMRRVARPGGFVACREGEVHAWTFYPDSQDLHDFVKLYMQIARAHGGQPAAARQLVALARKAGFERSSIAATASAWCYSNPEERAWWSQLWIDRLLYSSLAKKALQGKHADQDQLDRLARGWQRWAADDDGCLIIPNGEILCRV
ncbi:hypothetical protein MMC20_001113 [Loxospora ochrophaea]|nr:hypothetical protein [Loxospora ochrophaea]